MNLNKKTYDSFIWSLKYRPTKIEDVVLPDRIKNQFNKIIESGNMANLILSGPPGCSKTTLSFILADKMERQAMYINASDETGVDTLRTKVKQFVTSASFDGSKKIVIFDEMEMASNNLFGALRAFIEEFSKSTNFIFITNYKNKVPSPLLSRLESIEFTFTNEEMKAMKKEFYKSVLAILKKEDIKHDTKVVAHVVNNVFPDMRKILNELQKFAQQDALENMEVINSIIANVDEYFKLIREKDFNKTRKYIAQVGVNAQLFYSQIYNVFMKYVKPDCVPDAIILLGKYSYEAAFVVDQQINLMAFSTELMAGCEIRDNF
jgi:DNA polymerase III delta prime subunit